MEWHSETGARLDRGDELGRFNLGSTVILLFPAGSMRFDPELAGGRALQMGQAIGAFGRDER